MMIGEKIKRLRNEKGISLTELASRAGVSKSYLSSIERDLQQNPSIHFLEKVATVLDTTVQRLIFDETQEAQEPLDEDWVDLAREAMSAGISKQQFKEFLEFSKWQKQQNK